MRNHSKIRSPKAPILRKKAGRLEEEIKLTVKIFVLNKDENDDRDNEMKRDVKRWTKIDKNK